MDGSLRGLAEHAVRYSCDKKYYHSEMGTSTPLLHLESEIIILGGLLIIAVASVHRLYEDVKVVQTWQPSIVQSVKFTVPLSVCPLTLLLERDPAPTARRVGSRSLSRQRAQTMCVLQRRTHPHAHNANHPTQDCKFHVQRNICFAVLPLQLSLRVYMTTLTSSQARIRS